MIKIKSIYLLITLLILLVLFMGLIWLGIYVIILILLYSGLLCFLALIKFKYPFLNNVIKGMFLFLFVFFMAISIKLLTFEVYKIPSSSMENTLFHNDVIVVNKLKYGPRLPRSPFEIPWINIAFYANKKVRDSRNISWWNYKRFSGTTIIKNGDVMVFTMFENNMAIVKRCMGIAGDTLKIKKGNVFINNKYFNPSILINNADKFKVSDRKIIYKKLDSISTNTLSTTSSLYPKSKNLHWTLDDYGPFIIPKKGMTIYLTPENYVLYSKVINTHENVELKEILGSYYVNGNKVTSYKFKEDYYFMMGDHRKESMDSRYWGFVPESRIVGKVQCVLFSNYQNEFRWDRFFKSVN